jgi:hypothetical protein
MRPSTPTTYIWASSSQHPQIFYTVFGDLCPPNPAGTKEWCPTSPIKKYRKLEIQNPRKDPKLEIQNPRKDPKLEILNWKY